MAVTDERHAISQLGEEQGWQHRVNHRADVFTRGDKRVRVIWQGDSRISGAAFFDEEMYESYTRELDKVRTWLKR